MEKSRLGISVGVVAAVVYLAGLLDGFVLLLVAAFYVLFCEQNEWLRKSAVKAVILYHHPIHSYYKEKFTGGNNPPDCGSMDGKIGVVAETGECKNCGSCPYAKFGSGDNGGMACKQKRRVYILREGEILPVILTVPTGSLKEFTKYVTRLLQKGKKTNSVVTKFTLKKVQNSTGITFSQVVCSVDRALSPDEQQNINAMSEQVKAFAGHVAITDAE